MLQHLDLNLIHVIGEMLIWSNHNSDTWRVYEMSRAKQHRKPQKLYIREGKLQLTFCDQ